MKSIWTSFNLVRVTRWLIRFGACHVPANIGRRIYEHAGRAKDPAPLASLKGNQIGGV
jgi:hypothetical protein